MAPENHIVERMAARQRRGFRTRVGGQKSPPGMEGVSGLGFLSQLGQPMGAHPMGAAAMGAVPMGAQVFAHGAGAPGMPGLHPADDARGCRRPATGRRPRCTAAGSSEERTLHPASEGVRAAVFVEHPAFFDAYDELQVKYEMLRAHLLDGEPVTIVYAAFGYSRQTFYLLRDRLARRGLAGLRDARPGPVGPRTCMPAVVDFLRVQRADDPALSSPPLLDRLAVVRLGSIRRRRSRWD